jgi:hypothetical protein
MRLTRHDRPFCWDKPVYTHEAAGSRKDQVPYRWDAWTAYCTRAAMLLGLNNSEIADLLGMTNQICKAYRGSVNMQGWQDRTRRHGGLKRGESIGR